MIPSAEVLLFFQSVSPPEPGKEVYWIAGLMAGAIAFLFYQLREADKAKTAVHADALKRAHDREDRLLEVDAARTETMRQLVVASEKSATLTQTVVDGSLTLRQGIDANAKGIVDCTKAMEALTLEFRNVALRVQEAEAARRATDKSP